MLKELRKDLGFTQKELAEAAGLPLRTIQKYEGEEYKLENMTLKNALKLAAALKCEPADLVEDTVKDLCLVFKGDITLGYIKATSEEADIYCDYYNAKNGRENHEELTWEKLHPLPSKLPTK